MLLLICAYSIVCTCIIIRACANIFLNVSIKHNVCTPIEIINQSMLFSICAYSIVCTIIIKACAILISRLNGNEHILFSKMDLFGGGVGVFDVCTCISFFIYIAENNHVNKDLYHHQFVGFLFSFYGGNS